MSNRAYNFYPRVDIWAGMSRLRSGPDIETLYGGGGTGEQKSAET